MTTLIAAGDSFTWGNDLSDCDQLTPSKLSWAAVTADRLGFDYKCIATPGGSNQAIERKVIETVETMQDVYVAVMWTYPHRLEVKLNQALDNSNYFTISGWHSVSFEEKLKNWGNISEGQRRFVEQQHKDFERVGVAAISRAMTEFLHDDQYYLETLRSQVLLKNYLESRKIPYLFIPACDNVILDRIKTTDSFINSLIAISKTAHWLTEPNRGFVQWAAINDYKIGATNHPLEAACKDYAEKFVMPKVSGVS